MPVTPSAQKKIGENFCEFFLLLFFYQYLFIVKRRKFHMPDVYMHESAFIYDTKQWQMAGWRQ